MPAMMKRKRGPTKMIGWRLPEELLSEIDKICKNENVERTEFAITWLRKGVEDYRKNGIKEVC
jgi:metal-responsive CopG/Arc/MetJ family transcriptional regulator